MNKILNKNIIKVYFKHYKKLGDSKNSMKEPKETTADIGLF